MLSDDVIAEIQATVPALPSFYRQQWQPLQLDSTVVNALLASQEIAKGIQYIFEKGGENAARRNAQWFVSSVGSDDSGSAATAIQFLPERFVELARMVDASELSSTAAKAIFSELLTGAASPRQVAEDKNLLQVSDDAALLPIVDEVLADAASTKAVEDLKNGNDKVIGFLVGKVMKKSHGKANPELAQKLIRERIIQN